MCFYLRFRIYLLHVNFYKQKVLQQFRIFNRWNTRFLHAKFLKADQEKENLINKNAMKLINKAKNLA